MLTIKVKCTEIQWDTDEDREILETLPKDVTLTIEDYCEGDDLDDIIADMLSDEYGFCLFGFNYKILNA